MQKKERQQFYFNLLTTSYFSTLFRYRNNILLTKIKQTFSFKAFLVSGSTQHIVDQIFVLWFWILEFGFFVFKTRYIESRIKYWKNQSILPLDNRVLKKNDNQYIFQFSSRRRIFASFDKILFSILYGWNIQHVVDQNYIKYNFHKRELDVSTYNLRYDDGYFPYISRFQLSHLDLFDCKFGFKCYPTYSFFSYFTFQVYKYF